MTRKPEILAPAGDIPSLLAAFAGGADAVYMGLKNFSARMQAENFSTSELSRVVELAEEANRRIYIAFNTMLKPGEVDAAARLVARMCGKHSPHALIIQDPGMIEIAKSVGYEGELYLSTLANVTDQAGLRAAAALGVNRVIIPRELSIDEVRLLDAACPENLDLELFVHGALCWCVSGRCYWSSYMGGKSGLRGRCVQPCRRVYKQRKRSERAFSCLDLSLDVLAKTTLEMPHIACWKIEGRKKGPHYVYHITTAYRILRDEGQDAKARKEAEAIIGMALGRPTTRAHFLPQRDCAPTKADTQTSSGLLIGKIFLDDTGRPGIKPHQELLSGDYLRVGYEDENWHATLPVSRRTPKGGTLILRLAKHKTPKASTPVFLIDRREPELMNLIAQWKTRLEACPGKSASSVTIDLTPPQHVWPRKRPDMVVRSSIPHGPETRRRKDTLTGLWLTPRAVREVSRTVTPSMAWWLPPVIWPNEEDAWQRTLLEVRRNGGKHFVCNAPWQVALFDNPKAPGSRDDLDLIAGPFCNLANAYALNMAKNFGFTAAFVSPELPREDLLALPKVSPLPLGFIISGFWPMGIARHEPEGLRLEDPFQSPKNETFWARKYGQNTWIYPGWPLDLTEKRPELEAAGYSFFATMEEVPPKELPNSNRPGLFNWAGEVL